MNECCFKGSSMGLKVHTNSKTTPRYFGNRGVATPRYFGYRGVATPRCPSTGESFYCLYDKNFVLILICELSIWNFHRF